MYIEKFSLWYYYLAHIVCILYSLHAGDDRIAFSVHIVFITQIKYVFTVSIYFDVTFCM
jgi:hypothetical protein